MEREEVQKLLDEFRADLLKTVDSKNSGLAASISKDLKKTLEGLQKPQGDKTQGEVDVNALQSQIQSLQEKLQAKDTEAFENSRNQALKAAIANLGALEPNSLFKLYLLEHGQSLQSEGEGWLVEQDGKAISLEDSLKTYLESDEGKVFLPPSGTNGSSSEESNGQARPIEKSPTAEEALSQAFQTF